jgi:hypothetical protein
VAIDQARGDVAAGTVARERAGRFVHGRRHHVVPVSVEARLS